MRTKKAVVAAVVAVLALTGPAHAKGPTEGVIEGEGISGGGALLDEVGFFAAVFATTPDPMVDEPPSDALGPALTLRWSFPGPDGGTDNVVQVLYPYAEGGPLVFTDPDQPFFGSERTRGGWFQAPESLVTTLQAIGVPSADALVPAAAGGGSTWLPISASLAGVTVLVAALTLLVRRRAAPAPAAT